MSDLNSIYNQMQPLTSEDFRDIVALWKRKGHEHVVRVEFDDDTGETILIVQDYFDSSLSGFMKVKPWSDDEQYAHT